MPRIGASPFVWLGVFVVVIYGLLAVHNWRTWRAEYFEEEVYRYRPLVYHPKVRIQEDKRKIFPVRTDVFAPSLSATRLDSIRRRNTVESKRKCAKFDVFVYPPSPTASPLARALHEQLIRSNYATPDLPPSRACAFVVVADEPSELEKCAHLSGREDEHVVFLLNGTLNESLSIGHVFSNHQFGPGGIPFPLQMRNVSSPLEFTMPIYGPPRLPILQVHQEAIEKRAAINGCSAGSLKCLHSSSVDSIADNPGEFVFIGYTDPVPFQSAVWSALFGGSIPVVLNEHFGRLPLGDLIDWEAAAVRIGRPQLPFLLEELEEMSGREVMEMRRQGRFLFRHHFETIEGLVRATLSAVRIRLRVPAPMEQTIPSVLLNVTHLPASFEHKEVANLQTPFSSLRGSKHAFNRDPTFLDAFSPFDRLCEERPLGHLGALVARWTEERRGLRYASRLNGNMPDEEFTIVLMAYKRDDQLRHVLNKLEGLRFCRQILVVWSDVERQPPGADFWPRLHVPVHFVRAPRNSLNSRFLPFDLIETEAVFSMDDDFELPNQMIEFAFRVWRENRDTIVGVNERLGYVDPITQRGVYKFETEACRYNMILTSGAFFHRNYLAAYWKTLPAGVRDWVDEWTNCEDIAMNFLIADLSRKPPIKVTPTVGSRGLFTRNIRLSNRPEHLWNRAKCVEIFQQLFGYNPLLLSESRVDSVHFEHPNELRCFAGT